MDTNNQESTKFIAIIIITIFAIICIITAFYYGNELLWGSFEKFDNDDTKYLRSAQTLIETGKLTYANPEKSTVYIMPGIVLTLAPFVKLLGMERAAEAFRIFNIIIQSITLYMIFLIALKLFNPKVALLSLILNVIYLPNIYSSLQILTDTMFLFFMTLFILCAIYANDKKSYIILGIIWGTASLYRPTALVLPFILFILWIINKWQIKKMIKAFLYVIIPFIIMLTPWCIRNYIEFNRLSIFTLASGNPMLSGAFIENNYDDELINELYNDKLKNVDDEVLKNDIELEYFKKVFEHNLNENFWIYLKWNTLDKMFYNTFLPYYNSKLYGIKDFVVVSEHVAFLSMALYALIKLKNKYKWLIFAILTCFVLMHLPFLAWQRYIYPAFPFVIIISATIFDKNKGKQDCKDFFVNS